MIIKSVKVNVIVLGRTEKVIAGVAVLTWATSTVVSIIKKIKSKKGHDRYEGQ